ncbi:MAG: hypothetical protein methR_P2764 [Methyloprofundus sp.]|nr:MAG: hypothetical protein methR_P2764 [Methyloprofundus sp.]
MNLFCKKVLVDEGKMRGHVVSECSALQNLDHSEVIRKLIKQNNFFEPSEINIGVGNLGKYTSEKTFFLEYDPDFKQEKIQLLQQQTKDNTATSEDGNTTDEDIFDDEKVDIPQLSAVDQYEKLSLSERYYLTKAFERYLSSFKLHFIEWAAQGLVEQFLATNDPDAEESCDMVDWKIQAAAIYEKENIERFASDQWATFGGELDVVFNRELENLKAAADQECKILTENVEEKIDKAQLELDKAYVKCLAVKSVIAVVVLIFGIQFFCMLEESGYNIAQKNAKKWQSEAKIEAKNTTVFAHLSSIYNKQANDKPSLETKLVEFFQKNPDPKPANQPTVKSSSTIKSKDGAVISRMKFDDQEMLISAYINEFIKSECGWCDGPKSLPDGLSEKNQELLENLIDGDDLSQDDRKQLFSYVYTEYESPLCIDECNNTLLTHYHALRFIHQDWLPNLGTENILENRVDAKAAKSKLLMRWVKQPCSPPNGFRDIFASVSSNKSIQVADYAKKQILDNQIKTVGPCEMPSICNLVSIVADENATSSSMEKIKALVQQLNEIKIPSDKKNQTPLLDYLKIRYTLVLDRLNPEISTTKGNILDGLPQLISGTNRDSCIDNNLDSMSSELDELRNYNVILKELEKGSLSPMLLGYLSKTSGFSVGPTLLKLGKDEQLDPDQVIKKKLVIAALAVIKKKMSDEWAKEKSSPVNWGKSWGLLINEAQSLERAISKDDSLKGYGQILKTTKKMLLWMNYYDYKIVSTFSKTHQDATQTNFDVWINGEGGRALKNTLKTHTTSFIKPTNRKRFTQRYINTTSVKFDSVGFNQLFSDHTNLRSHMNELIGLKSELVSKESQKMANKRLNELLETYLSNYY